MECPECKGKGGKWYHTHSRLNPVNPHEYRECRACEGSGEMQIYPEYVQTGTFIDKCKVCDGTGEVEDLICPNCNGSGEGMYDDTKCSLCKGSGFYNGY